jgi:hypothetical protein
LTIGVNDFLDFVVALRAGLAEIPNRYTSDASPADQSE